MRKKAPRARFSLRLPFDSAIIRTHPGVHQSCFAALVKKFRHNVLDGAVKKRAFNARGLYWRQIKKAPPRHGRRKKNEADKFRPLRFQRANDQTRTGDLILTKDVLYRLSYISTSHACTAPTEAIIASRGGKCKCEQRIFATFSSGSRHGRAPTSQQPEYGGASCETNKKAAQKGAHANTSQRQRRKQAAQSTAYALGAAGTKAAKPH